MQREAQTSALNFRDESSAFEALCFVGELSTDLGRGCRRVHGLPLALR